MHGDEAWCCVGDFNELLSQREKDERRPQQQYRMDLFRDFLNQTGLMDLDLKGSRFTWLSNPKDGFITREKLDRVVVNWAWRFNFQHAIALALPIISSDHAPVILQPVPKASSGYSFKYEAIWEEHNDCDNVIRQGWNSNKENISNYEGLIDRTKTCKRTLQNWHQKNFKRADVEIAKHKVRLTELQNGGRADWREIKRVQDQIEKLWKQEQIFWGQRSRLKWLKWGDRNSSFFHATTIQRRDRNRLHRIKDKNGDWVEGQEDIFRAILDHFSEVYAAEECVGIAECLQTVQPKVSQEMNKSLMAQVTDVEIKKAVDSLGASKAPGLDGLNEMFYQNHWEVVKEEVCEAIKEFFRGEEFPVEINETVVALAPKVALPESIHQLRPISCCNFMSKVIAKIIVHRLRGFMDGLISENQSAFIGGRQIQDNLVIAQELFYALNKKDKGGKEHLAIKLDMSKAYDRL